MLCNVLSPFDYRAAMASSPIAFLNSHEQKPNGWDIAKGHSKCRVSQVEDEEILKLLATSLKSKSSKNKKKKARTSLPSLSGHQWFPERSLRFIRPL
jgi:hypothetical protein